MKPSQPAWRMGAMLILSQACAVIEGLPLGSQDELLRVQTNPDATVFEEGQVGDNRGVSNLAYLCLFFIIFVF